MTLAKAIKEGKLPNKDKQYFMDLFNLIGIQKVNRRWNLTENDIKELNKFLK